MSKLFTLNDIKNHCVHMLLGMWVAWTVAHLTGECWTCAIMTSMIVGVSVEAYQIIYKQESPWLLDRFFDIMSWTVGGLLGWVFYAH